MTIYTENLNFIATKSTIQRKYPGGWRKCLSDHKHQLGESVWFDDNLFRYGSKDYVLIATKMREWEQMGFVCVEMRHGKRYWADICVHATMQKSDIECEWLDYCNNGVFLKGSPPGKVVEPNSKDMLTLRKRLVADEFRKWAFWYFVFIAALIAFLKYTVTTW
jgi:hypothetical protein